MTSFSTCPTWMACDSKTCARDRRSHSTKAKVPRAHAQRTSDLSESRSHWSIVGDIDAIVVWSRWGFGRRLRSHESNSGRGVWRSSRTHRRRGSRAGPVFIRGEAARSWGRSWLLRRFAHQGGVPAQASAAVRTRELALRCRRRGRRWRQAPRAGRPRCRVCASRRPG